MGAGRFLLVAASLPTAFLPAVRAAGEPAPPGASLRVEEVRFASGGVQLAGRLLLPAGAGPHPGVALLHGSGEGRRDDPDARAVAEALARSGFAALTTDKRGVGDSGGDFASATFADLSADAVAAVEHLAARPDVRGDAIGLWGKSQGGGWIGPLAAAGSPRISFLVAVAAPLVTPEEFMHRLLAEGLRAKGAAPQEIEVAEAARRRLWDYLATGEGHAAAAAAIGAMAGEPWFDAAGLPSKVRPPEELAGLPPRTRSFLADRAFDPLPLFAGLEVPVLLVYGEADGKLPVAEYRALLERRLGSALGTRVELAMIAGLDHDLRPAGGASGEPGAPAESEPVGPAREALDLVIAWVGGRLGEERPVP